MSKEKPIRIAQIIGKWLGGGVESVVMNYYRNIDRSKIQFDFICDSDSTNIPYEEINELGGNVILIPPYQKVLKYHRELKKVLKEGNYKIVHSHINTLSVFSLWAAKSAKVPVRIAHSHSTTNKKEWKRNLLKQILRPINKLFATNYMACTEHAGRWMFGDREYNKGNVYILNNAIDLDKFRFNKKIRTKLRDELHIAPDTVVIGNVGRFTLAKNHFFTIDVFNKYHKRNNNSKLLFIGQGSLVDLAKAKVNELNLINDVIFLGQKENIYDYYNVMDVFLFPSLYEGLGMAAVEAQVSGLPCVVSTEVPEAIKISSRVKFVSLDDKLAHWVDLVNESASLERIEDYTEEIGMYDIKKEYKKLFVYYEDRLNNLKKHK